VRIIAGRLGGRTFDSPKGFKTHPMSDKMRGALFNVLGDIEGLTVLDAFAGSGALSFEAVSRGAARVLAVDSDRNAQKTIAENIKALRLGAQVKLIKASVSAWLATNLDVRFDLVLCDPPYNDLQPNLIKRLPSTLAPTGTLVLSWPPQQAAPDFADLTQVESRNYGDSTLLFYQFATDKNAPIR
jgi:16S rRNA (guanine966-N2)-methyltransferase